MEESKHATITAGLQCPLCLETISGPAVSLMGKCAQHGALVPMAVICRHHIAPAWLFANARQIRIAGQTALTQIAIAEAERSGRRLPSLRLPTIRRPLAQLPLLEERHAPFRQPPVWLQRLRNMARWARRLWLKWLRLHSRGFHSHTEVSDHGQERL
jgi:hypothetical protein